MSTEKGMWYAVIRKSDNSLYSVGTVLADPMPPEFYVKELGVDFKFDGKVWDSKTQTYIPDPTWTKIQAKLTALPGVTMLSTANKQTLLDFAYKLVYNPTELLG